jgi:hypothetical protein
MRKYDLERLGACLTLEPLGRLGGVPEKSGLVIKEAPGYPWT